MGFEGWNERDLKNYKNSLVKRKASLEEQLIKINKDTEKVNKEIMEDEGASLARL